MYELVNESGEAYDVFRMAGILFDKAPDAMLEFLLGRLPETERQHIREEIARDE